MLTPAQRQQLQVILRDWEQTVRGLGAEVHTGGMQLMEVAPGRWADWEGRRFDMVQIPAAKGASLDQAEIEAAERALAVLTEDQRQRWQKLLGRPFQRQNDASL